MRRHIDEVGMLALAGLVLLGAACAGDTNGQNFHAPGRAGSELGDSAPLAFVSRPPAEVQGNVVTLDVAVQGLSIVTADGDTSGRTGHLHVFVDRPPPPAGSAIPKEPGVVHTTDTRIAVAGLSVGRHRFSVVLGDGAHRRMGDAIAEAEVLVKGPSLEVWSPPIVGNGEAAVVNVKVDGLRLVPADGDRSGQSGHLHLFVDRPPTAAGAPIPREGGIIHTTDTAATLPTLAPGEHTVWVVAGDGTHVPLTPPVMAKTTFLVQG